MGGTSNFFVKLRVYYRRRHHKLSIVSAVLIIVLFYLIFLSNSGPSSKDIPSSTPVNHPDQDSWLHDLSESILSKFRLKTIPFAETEANIKESRPGSGGHTQKTQKEPVEKGKPLENPHEEGDQKVLDDSSLNDLNDKIRQNNRKKKIDDQTKIRLIKDMHKKIDPNNELLDLGYEFYDSIFRILFEGTPNINQLDRYLTDDRIYHARYDTTIKSDAKAKDSTNKDNLVFTEPYLSQFLQLSGAELTSMVESHDFIMKNLPDAAPKNLYKGNGIVFVGGGKFNWLTLLSIKSIRALGSELPIEVLIPKLDEYEPDLCARVFPALNARCIFLPYVLSGIQEDHINHIKSNRKKASNVDLFEFKGFQFKALAVLVLSFENVLLLDSDNIPVHTPDALFDEKPFTTDGLIVWPDFWKRATSPDYYRIAGIEISETEFLPKYNEVDGIYENDTSFESPIDLDSVPYHQRKGAIPDPSSESGQLLISKKTHTKALLVALYYNLFGPTHFYPLFSQGSDGEGDKETFLAATLAAHKPFYQVSKFLNAFGHFDEKNNFEGTGMGQYDPIEDYKYNKKREMLATKSEEEKQKIISKDLLMQKGPRILFVHANNPKLNPWDLKITNKIIDKKGNRFRLYGTGMKKRTGYDFETVQWTNMKFLLCELKIELEAFAKVNRNDLCNEINEHLEFLKSTIITLET